MNIYWTLLAIYLLAWTLHAYKQGFAISVSTFIVMAIPAVLTYMAKMEGV